MSSRAQHYQTYLTTYFRTIPASSRTIPAASNNRMLQRPYTDSEGKADCPIDVNSGERDNPVDLDLWVSLRELPAKDAVNEAGPASHGKLNS